MADPDRDGAVNRHEFVADTIPTNASSFLALSDVTVAGDHATLDWQGGIAATQFVERTTNLAMTTTWTTIFTNHPPTSVTAGFTDPTSPDRTLYYRIRAAR